MDCTTQLPKDVVMAISRFLKGLDIVCFLMTQKKWYTWFEQNGDFWKTQCQLFLRGEMHKKLEKITCLQSYLKMVIDGCIECGKFANYYPIIGQNLCDNCKFAEKNTYKLIYKTEAKKSYKVNDSDLEHLIFIAHRGGFYYLESDVAEIREKNQNKQGRRRKRKRI